MSTHQFQPDLPPPSNTVGVLGGYARICLMAQSTPLSRLFLLISFLMRFGTLSIGHSLMLTG